MSPPSLPPLVCSGRPIFGVENARFKKRAALGEPATGQRLSVKVAAGWSGWKGLWPARQGRRVGCYSSPAEALAAVSLSEYAMSHQNVEIVRPPGTVAAGTFRCHGEHHESRLRVRLVAGDRPYGDPR